VCVCRFEDLIAGPEPASRHLAEFLGIRLDSMFEPRPTAEVGFTETEMAQILEATAAERRFFDY
jgi:hypothetical protein